MQGMLEFISKIDSDFASRQNPFQLAFFNLQNIIKLRELKPSEIGRLTSFQGTVTRTTEVKPELNLGTFQCI
jgi:DNA replication licensing factor MCM6